MSISNQIKGLSVPLALDSKLILLVEPAVPSFAPLTLVNRVLGVSCKFKTAMLLTEEYFDTTQQWQDDQKYCQKLSKTPAFLGPSIEFVGI